MNNKTNIPIEVLIIAYLFLASGILGLTLFVYDFLYDLPNTILPVFIVHFLIYWYLLKLNNTWRVAAVFYLGINLCLGIFEVITLNKDIGFQYAEYTGLSAPVSFGLYFLYLITCLVLTVWAVFALTRKDIVSIYENGKQDIPNFLKFLTGK